MLRRLGRPLTNIICSDRAVLTQSINAKSPTSKLPTQAPILSQIITPTYVRCVSTSTESSAKEQASKPPHLSPSKETVVTLYTKKECSLCVPVKEAIQAALKATDKPRFRYEEVDIEDDRSSFTDYRYHIPVVKVNGVEIARHRMTRSQLEDALKKADESQ